MEKRLKFSVSLLACTTPRDRFVGEGYRNGMPLEETVERIAKIEEIKGLELSYPNNITENNLELMKTLIERYNLSVASIAASISTQRRWIRGALIAEDPKVREEAIGLVKRAMDIASDLGTEVRLWFGQDGYDYPFTTDYWAIQGRLVEGLKRCVVHNPKMKIALEYKNMEPKKHYFTGSAGRILSLIEEIGVDNLGVCLDIGHAYLAYENPAEIVALLSRRGRLFQIHMNDNYGYADDDLIPGSVHLINLLEILYWIRRCDYRGWCSFDVWPTLEDPFRCLEESVTLIRVLEEKLDKLDAVRMEELFRYRSFTESLQVLREILF